MILKLLLPLTTGNEIISEIQQAFINSNVSKLPMTDNLIAAIQIQTQ